MAAKDGSIIATIITIHMARKDAAASSHVCPGISIHAIDIVQPPGIGMSPIADMDPHQMIVLAALTTKSSAEIAKKARSEACSKSMRREIAGSPIAAIMGMTFAQRTLYSLWRLHQTPSSSLRPLGARSSHWYIPHRPSSPRAQVE